MYIILLNKNKKKSSPSILTLDMTVNQRTSSSNKRKKKPTPFPTFMPLRYGYVMLEGYNNHLLTYLLIGHSRCTTYKRIINILGNRR